MTVAKVLGGGVLALSVAAFPMAAGAETLKQALVSAYQNNPVISSALFSAKATAESVGLAASGTRPNIGLGASLKGNFVSVPGVGDSRTVPASLGLTYSQTLYDSGRTDAKVQQAKAVTEEAVQALRISEQNVLLSAVTAYMDVIKDTQLVSLRGDNVNFYQTQVKSSQDRLNLGEGTKIDVSQAQASLASGQALFEAAQAQLETDRATYEHWIGHPPRNLTSAYRLNGLVPATLGEALASGEARHPSILSAKAGIAAAQYAAESAEDAFGPELSATGSVGPSVSDLLTGSHDLRNNTQFGASVGLSFSLPIYSGGALGASTRQANLQAIKSNLDAQAARATVREDVITAWAALQNANAQIKSAQAAVDAGNLALQGTVQERDVGQATTLDVLNAQSTVTNAREQLITANAAKVIATFTLVAAEGRLSAQDLALNVTIKSPEGYITKAADIWQELRQID